MPSATPTSAAAGRAAPRTPALLLTVCALLLAVGPAPAAAGCARGDLPCFCKAAGGWWEVPPSPLLPTCKVKFYHQGKER